jgi:hypothetical protein
VNPYYDFHGREDDKADAILDWITRDYSHARCDCGGVLVAQFTRFTGLVAVRCSVCNELHEEVEL